MVEVLAQTLTRSKEPALAEAISTGKITTEEIIRQIKAGACGGQRHGFNLHDLIFTPAYAADCTFTTIEGKPITVSDKSGCLEALISALGGQVQAVSLHGHAFGLGLKDGVVEQGEEFAELLSDPKELMSAVSALASELISDPTGTAQKYGIAIVGGMQENAYKYVAALERGDYREAGKLAAGLAIDLTLKVVVPAAAAGTTILKTSVAMQKVANRIAKKSDGVGGKGVGKVGREAPANAGKAGASPAGKSPSEAGEAAVAGNAGRGGSPNRTGTAEPNPGTRPGATDAEAGGASYYDQYKKADGSGWDWPDNLGFVGTPSEATVPVGARLDRYGSADGSFMSPARTPLEQRAMAPGSAAEPLHTYEVAKPLPVIQGEVAPAFGQSGGGTQMLPNLSERVNVDWLLRNGYLREVN